MFYLPNNMAITCNCASLDLGVLVTFIYPTQSVCVCGTWVKAEATALLLDWEGN